MNFDIVIVTKLDHLYIVNLALPYIREYVNNNGKIIIISKKKNEKYFNKLGSDIFFIHEEQVIPGLSIKLLKKLNIYGFPKRAGWYYQQLLKYGVAYLEEVSENFLVWDGDTIPLKKIEIIDKNRKYNFVKSTEYHKPYFDNYKILLGEDPKYEFSFISQFMIFNKKILTELFNRIEKNFSNKNKWYWIILENMQGKHGSLFSEYETYGNYMKNHYPELCNFIDIKWLREGTEYLGSPFPKYKDLEKIPKEYYYVSFELKASKITSKIKKKFFLHSYPYYFLLKQFVIKYLKF